MEQLPRDTPASRAPPTHVPYQNPDAQPVPTGKQHLGPQVHADDRRVPGVPDHWHLDRHGWQYRQHCQPGPHGNRDHDRARGAATSNADTQQGCCDWPGDDHRRERARGIRGRRGRQAWPLAHQRRDRLVNCYGATLSSLNTSDIIDNNIVIGPDMVQIDTGVKAFQVSGPTPAGVGCSGLTAIAPRVPS